MRRSALQRRTPLQSTDTLERRTPLRAVEPKRRTRAVSPATAAQKERVLHKACIVCSRGPCHPAHLVDRSLAPASGDEEKLVVPLCPQCHFDYDEGDLDLLPYLEPHYREEQAAAVEAVGLARAYRRITGEHRAPGDGT